MHLCSMTDDELQTHCHPCILVISLHGLRNNVLWINIITFLRESYIYVLDEQNPVPGFLGGCYVNSVSAPSGYDKLWQV